MLKRKRKFVIALSSLTFSFILALTGTVDGSNWVAAVGLVVGLYSGAEAAEGWAHAHNREED